LNNADHWPLLCTDRDIARFHQQLGVQEPYVRDKNEKCFIKVAITFLTENQAEIQTHILLGQQGEKKTFAKKSSFV